jgi:hypothetical protein
VRNRTILLLVLSLYLACYLWAYATIVSPAFADDGFALTWPDPGAMVWLITLALLPALVLPYSFSRPSALILWLLYLAVYIPSILVPALSLTIPFEKLLPLQLCLLLCMGILCLAARGGLLAVSPITLSPTVFWPAFLLVWGSCLAYIGKSAGVDRLVSNLASLFQGGTEYAIRSGLREMGLTMEAGQILGYVIGQLSHALNPFLIAFGLVYRRRVCLIAGIVGQIVVFSLTGFKTSILSVLLLVLVAVFMRRWRRSFCLVMIAGLIATVLLCALGDRAAGNVYFSSLLTRRGLMTPGLLTGFYFEHYSHFSPVGVGFHFSHDRSVLGPANEIGFAYFGSVEVNANANMWAEAFAELGLPGMVGYTILVAFAIWIYDSISAKRNPELALLVATMPAIMLSNTAPTTVLVSHGGIVAALVLYLSPSSKPGAALEAEIEPEESHLISAARTSV